jgi:hypothetical protein
MQYISTSPLSFSHNNFLTNNRIARVCMRTTVIRIIFKLHYTARITLWLSQSSSTLSTPVILFLLLRCGSKEIAADIKILRGSHSPPFLSLPPVLCLYFCSSSINHKSIARSGLFFTFSICHPSSPFPSSALAAKEKEN